jgi:hypothetical protein
MLVPVDSAITGKDWRAGRVRIMDDGTVRSIHWWAPKLPCAASDRTPTVVFVSGLFNEAPSFAQVRPWRFGWFGLAKTVNEKKRLFRRKDLAHLMRETYPDVLATLEPNQSSLSA